MPKFRGSQNPSRVLWIGGLPRRISRTALTNFWSRLGCAVDVRRRPFKYVTTHGPAGRSLTYESTILNGDAHVEFASIKDALRAVRQGASHRFRYRQRLLDIDFATWVFYAEHAYRVVYISGWPASDGRPALLRWTYDILNIARATVRTSLPVYPRAQILRHGAFLRFRAIYDARAGRFACRMDGWDRR